MSWVDHVEESVSVISELRSTATSEAVIAAVRLLRAAVANRKPILVCGNGGSAADSMHFAAELVGRFKVDRPAIRCLSLASDPAIMTAWANDVGFDDVFRRQVEAHGEPGGVLVVISTSGRSKNVLAAHAAAAKKKMATIALTGRAGLQGPRPTVLIAVRSTETALVQQAHEVIYHYLAGRTEEQSE